MDELDETIKKLFAQVYGVDANSADILVLSDLPIGPTLSDDGNHYFWCIGQGISFLLVFTVEQKTLNVHIWLREIKDPQQLDENPNYQFTAMNFDAMPDFDGCLHIAADFIGKDKAYFDAMAARLAMLANIKDISRMEPQAELYVGPAKFFQRRGIS